MRDDRIIDTMQKDNRKLVKDDGRIKCKWMTEYCGGLMHGI